MKMRWIARALALAMLAAALLSGLALAETDAAQAKAATYSLKLGVKETFQINAAAIPGAEGKTLEFKSKDKKIATVSASGLITAKKKGSTTIGVGYGNTLLATCTVKVLAAPGKVTLSETGALMNVGETRTLKAALPKNTASALTFKSSDEKVATVSAEGKITALAAGEATVTASAFNGKKAECKVVVVSGKAPAKLTLNVGTLALQVKESFKLVPAVDEGCDAVYRFTSKNSKVAKVSSKGVVTGVKKGSTKITVETHNGLKQTVNVTVRKALSLKEVYGMLTSSQETFLANAKALKLKKDVDQAGNVMYYNSQLALMMFSNSNRVYVSAASKPKYSVQGAHTGMSLEQAAAKLAEGGWKLAEKQKADSNGATEWVFKKDGDATHKVEITSEDGVEIMAIQAEMSW